MNARLTWWCLCRWLVLLLVVAGQAPGLAAPSSAAAAGGPHAGGVLGGPAEPLLAPGTPVAGISAKPTWQDPLDGKADSGATSFSGPRATTKPASGGVSWVPGSAGQAASLSAMDSYVGYAGSRLRPDQGSIVFKHKPIANVAGVYGQRHASWTDYGQHKPPQSGFLVDTIGWNAAPKGSFGLTLNPAAGGGLAFGIWDGSKWHYVTWTAPKDWQWDPNRWYELGVTWGPKGMAILVDGEQKAAIPDVVQVNNSIPWFLGQGPWYWPYGPHSMMGAYDDLRVYGEQIGPYAPPTAAGAPAAKPSPAAATPPGSTTSSGSPTTSTSPTRSAGGSPASPVASGVAATKTPIGAPGQSTQPGAATKSPSGASSPPKQSKPGPIEQIVGPVAGLPGGATGPVAGAVTTLDSLNLSDNLPGGQSGPVASAVDQLPGGTAVLCSLPLIVGVVLLALLAALLGFAGGRRRRHEGLPPSPTIAGFPGAANGPVVAGAPLPTPPTPPAFSTPPPATLAGAPPTALAGAPALQPPTGVGATGFCDQCGAPQKAGVRFCGRCGAPNGSA